MSRSTRRGRASLVVFWLALQAGSAGSARADAPVAGDVEEARKQYARGVALYEQGADEAALAALERAYQLAPNWKVLYELGIVESAVHDFAASLKYFEQYLSEGGDALKPARKQEVSGYVTQLRQQVATIDVATVAGADIKVDDLVVATAPLAKPLVVNPGHHKLGASKDGVIAESRMVSLAGGDQVRVELDFGPAAAGPVSGPEVAPPPEPAPAPPVDRDTHPLPAHPTPPPIWIGWVVAGVFAGAAIVTGVEALTTNDQLTDAKTRGPSTPGALGSLSSRARAFGLASDLSTTAAIVTGGITLYFALRSRPSQPPPPGLATSSLRIGLGVLSFEGHF